MKPRPARADVMRQVAAETGRETEYEMERLRTENAKLSAGIRVSPVMVNLAVAIAVPCLVGIAATGFRMWSADAVRAEKLDVIVELQKELKDKGEGRDRAIADNQMQLRAIEGGLTTVNNNFRDLKITVDEYRREQIEMGKQLHDISTQLRLRSEPSASLKRP